MTALVCVTRGKCQNHPINKKEIPTTKQTYPNDNVLQPVAFWEDTKLNRYNLFDRGPLQTIKRAVERFEKEVGVFFVDAHWR